MINFEDYCKYVWNLNTLGTFWNTIIIRELKKYIYIKIFKHLWILQKACIRIKRIFHFQASKNAQCKCRIQNFWLNILTELPWMTLSDTIHLYSLLALSSVLRISTREISCHETTSPIECYYNSEITTFQSF